MSIARVLICECPALIYRCCATSVCQHSTQGEGMLSFIAELHSIDWRQCRHAPSSLLLLLQVSIGFWLSTLTVDPACTSLGMSPTLSSIAYLRGPTIEKQVLSSHNALLFCKAYFLPWFKINNQCNGFKEFSPQITINFLRSNLDAKLGMDNVDQIYQQGNRAEWLL